MAGSSKVHVPLARFIPMVLFAGLVGVVLPLGGIAQAAEPIASLKVTKTNFPGANPEPGGSVGFEVTVENPNDFAVSITNVTDTVVREGVADTTFRVCDGNIGNEIRGTLAAGESASCSFTLSNYAPAYEKSVTNTVRVSMAVIPGVTPGSGALFLIADEDMIDNKTVGYLGEGNCLTDIPPDCFPGVPKTFSDIEVNDNHPGRPERSPLDFFIDETNEDAVITLPTGQEQDEGLFGLRTILPSWDAAGAGSGLANFFGDPSDPFDYNGADVVDQSASDANPEQPHKVGIGLGNGDNPEVLLDKIPQVLAYRAEQLRQLVGQQICFLVKDSDVSYDKEKEEGNLQGEYLGVAAGEVLAVDGSAPTLTALGVIGTGSALPALRIRVLDPRDVCSSPAAVVQTGGGEADSTLTMPTAPLSTSVAPTVVEGVVAENVTAAPPVPAPLLELPRTGSPALREATLLALALLLAGTAVRALGRRRRGLMGSQGESRLRASTAAR